MIPKYIHIFWDDLKNIPFIVKKCIQNIKYKNPDFKVFLYSKKDIPFKLYKNTYAQYLSDIFRLYILYIKGGIYLDASTLCVNSLDCVFDFNDNRLQGYETPWGGLNMENSILSVAPYNKFVYYWLKECLLVNNVGPKIYLKYYKKYINIELKKHLPYLVNFVAYNVASFKLFNNKFKENDYIKLLIKSSDINGPIYYIDYNNRNLQKSVYYLLNSEKLVNQNCIIKFRKDERNLINQKIKEKKFNKNSFIIKLLNIL